MNMEQSNVLIDDEGHPKISGFGSAHISNKHLPLYSGTIVVDSRYTAPEVIESMLQDWHNGFLINNPEVGVNIFTKKSDIYTFACVCFQVLLPYY